jgi:adenine-specific DNA-methyltransferase
MLSNAVAKLEHAYPFDVVAPSRFGDLDPDKLRGGYYTPTELTQWLCSWAIRSARDSVLEPSCGDGAFAISAALRLKELGATVDLTSCQLCAIEITDGEAEKASARLAQVLGRPRGNAVAAADFFDWLQRHPALQFDVVVGNPPFIRYQSFPEPSRSKAMALMQDVGLKPNRLTNIWVPFVVAAASRLRPEGRLAMVLPAELLQVTYASQLRSFLTDRFRRIDVVTCNHLFFENAEQEVVLLLADGALPAADPQNSCEVAFTQVDAVSDITSREPIGFLVAAETKDVRHESEKWLKYFLSNAEIGLMRSLRSSSSIATLSAHGSVDVGVVTGKNEMFVLTAAQLAEFDLAKFAVPLVSRASHLRGISINKVEWSRLAAGGERVYLLDLTGVLDGELSPRARAFIAAGEAKGFHLGYKCAIRKPWYAVPSIWVSDGFAFRQIYDFPRLVVNEARATATDTIHRLTCRDPAGLVSASLTYLTGASAEIEGRSYGGGVLELEPTEAERLLLPAALEGALPVEEADGLIRKGKLQQVLDENSRLVLMPMGLTAGDCAMLSEIWLKMRDRRNARRRKRA